MQMQRSNIKCIRCDNDAVPINVLGVAKVGAYCRECGKNLVHELFGQKRG